MDLLTVCHLRKGHLSFERGVDLTTRELTREVSAICSVLIEVYWAASINTHRGESIIGSLGVRSMQMSDAKLHPALIIRGILRSIGRESRLYNPITSVIISASSDAKLSRTNAFVHILGAPVRITASRYH